jgi:hypothetical protein
MMVKIIQLLISWWYTGTPIPEPDQSPESKVLDPDPTKSFGSLRMRNPNTEAESQKNALEKSERKKVNEKRKGSLK